MHKVRYVLTTGSHTQLADFPPRLRCTPHRSRPFRRKWKVTSAAAARARRLVGAAGVDRYAPIELGASARDGGNRLGADCAPLWEMSASRGRAARACSDHSVPLTWINAPAASIAMLDWRSMHVSRDFMNKAVRIIREEHQRYGSVLNLVRNLLEDAGEAHRSLDAELFERAFDYVEEFIDEYHHPKEEDYLFRAVRRRSREANALVEQLEAEHVDGGRMLIELRAALAAWRRTRSDVDFQIFRDLAEAYIDFATRHAMKENDELIPIAERVLTYEDWAAVDAAFENNDDPAFGAVPQARFANLLRELERQALAPHGHGVGP